MILRDAYAWRCLVDGWRARRTSAALSVHCAGVVTTQTLDRSTAGCFHAVLLLDAVWAATPLLFLGQLHGLVLLCAAALAYLPFSQRTLLYSAYANTGGRSSAIQLPGK